MYILGIKHDCALGNLKLSRGWLNHLFHVLKLFMRHFASLAWNLTKLSEKSIFWSPLTIGNITVSYIYIIQYCGFVNIRGHTFSWTVDHVRFCSSMNIWFRWSSSLGVQRMGIKSHYITNAFILREGGGGGAILRLFRENLKECR